MASKLAMLVNTEESMARFRSLYQIPPSISLTYCNSDDFPVINRDEILLPIMAIVEGGVRFPLHSFLIDFLQTVNATPSQISVNTFRIIMGVIAINRLLDVNLTIREILAVYQYKCLGPKSNTLSHLVARNVNEKLVNGLPSTNKGFEKDYLRVGGDWWPGSSRCRSEFGQPDQRRLESARKQGDAELIRRVLAANICVDERGEPRSAPLLLGYEPQVKSFLEGPVVLRSEAVEIPPRAPYIAQPAEVERPEDFPDRVPTGQVYAMATPINPFEVMGKRSTVIPSRKAKDKGKGKRKAPEAPKILKRPLEEISITESEGQPIPERVPSPEPARGQISEEPEQEEELQPRKKKGRNEPPMIPTEGPSSHVSAWDPALLFGEHPITVQDSIMDNPDNEVSGQIARGLAFATCLPKDMNKWAGTQPGPAFRHITKNLITQSSTDCPRNTKKPWPNTRKVMSDTLRAASENLKKLEDEISKKANLIKEAEERARAEGTKRSEAEERARAEGTKRSEAEAEVVRLNERVGKLESECISRLNKAHQEGKREGEEKGMEEGLQKGKALGREGAMGEVATQFQLVYNSGFRLGWKSALYKTEHPETSELFLRTGTPLPFPDAGLQESDDEGSEEAGVDEEEEEEEGEEGQQGKEGKEGEEEKEDGGELEAREVVEGEGRKEEEADKEKERKEGEGRKEEEKEKEEREAIAEGSQLPEDDRTEPTVVLLDVVDLTEQTSTTSEQPPNS
uniref:Uncharacterized protein n=1 Tax=Fagus sylvatica TaxID=28930 RepID=A0A2N9EP46_FAGSY